ncbi:MAG TPA: nitronate monooxygenase [Paracoccaceae bacterium]|nr:nitronate monooxygenase [Paracoccaceae bacterium]
MAQRDLMQRLGLRLPILQAPMAGYATPGLAAAVTNAGGLGALGTATLAPAQIVAQLAEVRARTNGPFNLNFFCHADPRPAAAEEAAALAAVAPWFEAAGLPRPAALPPAPYPAFGPADLARLLADPPAVASFHFGHPGADAVAALQSAGTVVLATATTVTEARALEAAGVDAVIAQGWEAGGHRGAFAAEAPDRGIGLMALIPAVVDAVRLPVIAAGGIMDGRGIAAALTLGASAVQMGTAFLRCPETVVSAAHAAALAAPEDDTHLTAGYSGRPARARRTAFGIALAGGFAPYPLPRPLTQALAAADPAAYAFHLQGQGAPLARALPAADLIAALAAETRAALAATTGGHRWISA